MNKTTQLKINLIDKIKKICENNVSLHGYSNLEYAEEFIENTYPIDIAHYPYAISIGMRINDDITNTINIPGAEEAYLKEYLEVNNKLDDIAQEIVSLIIKEGYDAKSIPASDISSKDKLAGELSHKLIANLAGLGWIGKSCLLITPEYGPRLRWASILTNLPVPYCKNMLKSRCGNCSLCVENCPVSAFKNRKFIKNEPRELRYDAYKCNNHMDELEHKNRPRLCGVCVKICPWG